MTGEPFDIFRLPDANNDGAISTCIPYRLDITSLAVGDLLEIKMKFSGTGKEKERLVEKHLEDSRVQIIVPINDPEMISPGPPDWIELFYGPGIFLQRKTWDEGNSAKIVIRRDTEESTYVDMDILIVLNKLSLKPDEFHLLIESKKVLSTGGSLVISEQEIKFTNDKSILCYDGDDENLIDQVFSKKSGYEIKNRGSMFHPKQLHSYNSVYRSLESRIEAESPLNISYIGPDTCENLHSTIRAVNSLVSKGLKVSNFFVLFTQWDERSMQSLGITVPGYFKEKGCNFQVKPLRISDEIGIKSDLIISTYVTNWAFNSGKRGSAAEQYLSNILKQIKNESSMIISIDPFDEKRVARSFYQLGHQGAPTIVYQSAGLELQDSAPGGYGDIIQEREREICWVTSYKSKSQAQAIIEPAVPKPNDIAQSLGVVSPTGRDAYLERLSTPMLEKYATWSDVVTDEGIDEEIDEEIHGEVNEEIEMQSLNDNPDVSLLSMESLLEEKENFRIIIGGPGDGKTVFLQQLGWSKRSSEDEVTIILSARRLTRKEHMLTLAMHDSEDKISKFVEILEKESLRKYESLSWAGNIKTWIQSNLTINLKIDALDEVRDLKSRKKLFSYLLEFCNYRENINVTLSMRENILSKTMKDVEIYLESESVGFPIEDLGVNGENGIESYLAQIPIYKLTWNEADIVHKFIPSLLRGWNMVIDLQSKNELGRFIAKSTRSLNRSSRGSRIFLKNPLRAVWLVRFVYDQSINLDDMDLSEFENEILRLSVKNRFENRRRIDNVSNSILDELLDFVSTLSVLDYEWAGNENNFTSEEREKFVNLIVTSDAVSEFFREVDRRDLELFLYEDMSLLYIADDDNLAWIHENLREHAIARGLMKYNRKNSIPNSLLSSWGFEPPSIYDIFFTPDKTCSIELSEAIRRIIPTSLLIQITVEWLNELKNEDLNLDGINVDEVDGNNDLTNLANLVSICDDITLFSKNKRDELNQQAKDHVARRNILNSKVRNHINLMREQRDEREYFNGVVKDKKKFRKSVSEKVKQTKLRLAESNSDEKKSLRSDYNNALKEHEQAHTEVQDAAHKAQEAHELMEQYQKELDKLREIAEKEHRALRKSKKDSDVHHNRYIFLFTRLNRELKKRKKSLLSDIGEEMQSEEWQEKVKSSARQFLSQNLGFSQEGRSDINEIFVLPKGHECELIILTDYGQLKLELNDNSFGKLRLYLEGKFQTRFHVKSMGNSILREHVVEFIETNLDSIVEEWSGDHKLNIHSWEIEKLALPNLPKDLENRKIILRSKTPILIKDAGLLSNLNLKLKTVFGSPIYVDCHAIDVYPIDVKERYLQICESKSLTKLVIDIQVTPLENGVVGRNIIVETSNSEVLTSIQKEAADALGNEFGKPFFINYIANLPPLDIEVVRLKLTDIINRIIEPDSDFFELHEIKSYALDGIDGRWIQVKCRPVMRLIGANGIISDGIKEELTKEFGYVRFTASPKDVTFTDVKDVIETYITAKKQGKSLEEIKLHIETKDLKRGGVILPNRHVLINSSDNVWMNYRRKKIMKKLIHEFEGPFRIIVPKSKAVNLRSADVKNCVNNFLEEYKFELETEKEYPIKGVEVTDHRRTTGREVMIDWPIDSDILDNNVDKARVMLKKQLRKHLNDKFGPPFAIYFKTKRREVSKEMIDEYFDSYLKSESESYSITTSPHYGYPHRRITIHGLQINHKEKKIILKELESLFGPPFILVAPRHT